MARTEIKINDVSENTLTGSVFRSELEFYNETKSYDAGDIVIWKTDRWKATQAISANNKGDLSNAPDLNTSWQKIEPINWNAYPSSVQTFSDTAVPLAIDTERQSDPFGRLTVDTNDNSIVFNVTGSVILHFEFSAKSHVGLKVLQG